MSDLAKAFDEGRRRFAEYIASLSDAAREFYLGFLRFVEEGGLKGPGARPKPYNPEIEKSKLMCKGKDGRDYATIETLRQANETWARTHFPKKLKKNLVGPIHTKDLVDKIETKSPLD